VLGVPDKPEEYTAPKDVQLLPTDLSALQARAAALGLTKSQFEQEAKAYAEGRDKVTSVRAEAQAALRVELGAAFAERTALVAAAASKLGFPPALVADLKNGAVDMPTYKAFSAIAKSFSEGGQAALQMDGGGAGSSQTPAELEQAMAEIRANPAYRESSPRGRLLQAKHRELAEKRWG
jgi:hypothetical protein